MEKAVNVYYLHGIPKETFDELKDLGYDINIPKEKGKPQAMALHNPEDYILIFGIYFTLEVTKELAKGTAKKLLKNFTVSVKNIWGKLQDTKPAIIRAKQEPEYKLPKACIVFDISDEEKTTLEITGETSEKEMGTILNGYIELVKLQYENRLKEIELKERYRIQNKKKKK